MDRPTNYLEANKILAEFEGIAKVDPRASSGKSISLPTGVTVDFEACGDGFLKYHEDWNWLMRIVDKISEVSNDNKGKFLTWSSRPFSVRIENGEAHIIIDGGTMPDDPIHNTFPTYKLNASHGISRVYEGLLDFVVWYNNNLKKYE